MRSLLTSIVLTAILIATPVSASGQTSCSTQEIPERFDVLEADVNSKQGKLVLRIASLGGSTADGLLLLHPDDGGAPELFRPEDLLNVSCADTDGDGVAGVVLIEVVFVSEGSGEIVVVTIVPESDVDQTGHVVTAVRVAGGGRDAQWMGRPIWVTDIRDPAHPQ